MSIEHILSDGDKEERFARAAPQESYGARMTRILRKHYSNKTLKLLSRIPGLGNLEALANSPQLMPLSSDARFMANWYYKPFGASDKPASLEEMPWDYIEDKQEDVPFFGLREYWYPAIVSEDLPHNQVKTVRLLGDNIVLFRGKDGKIGALENRCPHRGPLLSLGQSNVWDIGTITCRYHGATFNTKGDCVAFLGDGADSPACGNARYKVRSYPAFERNGVVFLWMGEEEPEDIMTNIPRAPDALADGHSFVFTGQIPYSYLNMIDNATDMTHVGCLHRTCVLFGDQKMGGGVTSEDLGGVGVRGRLEMPGEQNGSKTIEEIEWYMPGMVFHGREFMDGILNGLVFWFVPNDAGNFTAWFIGSVDKTKASKRKAKGIKNKLQAAMQTKLLPNLACLIGGDAPMQMSQGRVVRWDQEMLVRGDKAVVMCRRMLKAQHKKEMEARKAKGLDPLHHRVKNQSNDEQVLTPFKNA